MSEEKRNEEVLDEVTETEETKEKEYDLRNRDEIFQMFKDNSDGDFIKSHIINYINVMKKEFEVDNYEVVFLYDEINSLSSHHSDKIYQVTNGCDKDILFVLNNNGGSIDPAYLISKMCKKRAKSKYVVAIPRRAKSAATLLSLGADEIHMGVMSELGPIDPQIKGLPALGLGNSLEYIGGIVSKYPDTATMFSNYLIEKLDLSILGYMERVSESAAQYAVRLLENKELTDGRNASEIANTLVYHYKDHGFVIDVEEATSLFGENIIKSDTKEYMFANQLYTSFNLIELIYRYLHDKEFSYVGTVIDGFETSNIRK